MVLPNLAVSSLNMQGLAAKYFRLILAFTMSGFIHAAGAYCATRGSLGDMRMFILQACAIILEDCVIALGKRAGIRKSGMAARWIIATASANVPCDSMDCLIGFSMDDYVVLFLSERLDWRATLGRYARNRRPTESSVESCIVVEAGDRCLERGWGAFDNPHALKAARLRVMSPSWVPASY